MNETVRIIVARLPGKAVLVPADIAAACGHSGTTGVLRAIQCGEMEAVLMGGRYLVARAEAVRWIESCRYVAEEAR